LTESVPADSSERCLNIVNKIFDIHSAKLEDTKAFQTINHEDGCEAFRYWLEQMRIVLDEPVNVNITQSLRDDGVDVLLVFLKSKVKFGFQIKSDNDVHKKDFTKNTIAQIERSRKHGVYKFFLAICADLTDKSQREKVRGLTSEISEMGDYCHIFSPEKTLRIINVYTEKQHPINLIEGMAQILVMLGAIQKKLADDPYYAPEVSLTYKLKKQLDEKEYPIRGNLTVKCPKGTLTVWDILKEIQLTGKPITIPEENIEKFEVFTGTQRLIPEGTKIKYLTITPEKPKLQPVIIETLDIEDGTPITFENVIFVRDAVKGTTVHLSTHENNLPFTFRCSLDKEQTVGNIGFGIDDTATDVGQLLKFERFATALSKGQEVLFKTPNGVTIFKSKIRQMEFKPLDEQWLKLLNDLEYIQKRTAHSMYLPKTIEPNDLGKVHYLVQLLRNGKTDFPSLRFKIGFTKKNAHTFLQELKEKKAIKDTDLRVDPLKIDLFGKEILLGSGGYFIPEIIPVEKIEDLEKAIDELKEDETIKIDVKSAGLSRYYVLKNVGETAFSGLPMFWAASLFKIRQSML